MEVATKPLTKYMDDDLMHIFVNTPTSKPKIPTSKDK